MRVVKKLLVGKVSEKHSHPISPLHKRISNIQSIWNNDHEDDNGIEKIVRLFLSISQLFFLGIYIKHFANKFGHEYKDLAMDLYVLSKVIFPFLILINDWQNHDYVIWILVFLLLETILYIPTLIFASDLFSRPRSYKRSMLLLFFNYIEVVVSFAVLYTLGDNMNKPFEHWFDSVYFSLISSNSIGYGDYYPVTTFGKVLVSLQALFFLSFVILFLNFFSTKVKSKGYFEDEEI
ncbi:potassium channel family protein [Flavobacterium cheniae]|uniref:Ion channel n=1 Tax=Flavobacterium cheniae TaxID=295428 RepID=A0A562KRW7_9FLAO|nr:potassium channel family protein [Flavobacterium cheniae]TDR25738.1 ion channel [Flavobacterium cheniae]TWH98077.1 ion channel [Flavobacterium cheniae]